MQKLRPPLECCRLSPVVQLFDRLTNLRLRPPFWNVFIAAPLNASDVATVTVRLCFKVDICRFLLFCNSLILVSYSAGSVQSFPRTLRKGPS